MPSKERKTSPALEAFKASIPVLLGYITIGFGFGLLAVNAGYPAWFALAMSVFVFAGAAQYIGIGLFAAGASIPEIAIITLVANIRHAVYGLSLIELFAAHPRIRPYLVFALTDETYALISSVNNEKRKDGTFLLLVSAFDQLYWVAGTALGALAGSLIPYRVEGLSFALTAMFIVLGVEQALKLKKLFPFLIAAAATIAAKLLIGDRLTIVVGLAAAIVLTFPFAKRGGGNAQPR
ncbi:MAG: AzlC family ABC transporter permease [Spirochaetes bacterium]|nr:AzlC family ABC transporter permease [Spirochaetota bacterium]